MKLTESPSTMYHTIIFSARGLLTDAEALRALTALGVRLADDGQSGRTRSAVSGHWQACGLRSDGLVELWAADSDGGRLARLLESAGIPCSSAVCTADRPHDERG